MDSLGPTGEHHFAEICTKAGLICNKATHDRAGWDFIVEFPFKPHVVGEALDSREKPADFRAQIKATVGASKYIKLRLSSAHWLATEWTPAFIVVLVFNKQGEREELYAIHVIDDALERILKRVRIAQAQGEAALNQKWIKLDYANLGRRFQDNTALIGYFEEIAGECRHDYTARKLNQIKNLGVVNGRYRLAFTLNAATPKSYVEFMLGHATVQVNDLCVTDVRWNVPLPMHEETSGNVIVRPDYRNATLKILSRVAKKAIALSVKVNAAAIPFKDGGRYGKAVFLGDCIEFQLEDDAGMRSFSFRTNLMGNRSLNQHTSISAIYEIVALGPCDVQVREEGRLPLLFPLETETDQLDLQQVLKWREDLENVRTLLSAVGANDIFFTWEQLNFQSPSIVFLARLFNNTLDDRTISVDLVDNGQVLFDDSRMSALLVGHLIFGDTAIVFSIAGDGNVFRQAGGCTLTIANIVLDEIDYLSRDDAESADFPRMMQDRKKPHIFIRTQENFINPTRKDLAQSA